MRLRGAGTFLGLGLSLIGTAAFAQDGCPPADTNITNFGPSTSVLFDVFNVTAPTPGGVASATCNTEIRPGEAGFTLYDLDYRGFVDATDAGQSATLESNAPGGGASATFDGPFSDLVEMDERIGRNPNEAVVIDTTLSAFAGLGAFDAFAVLESIDMIQIGSVSEASFIGSLNALADQRRAIALGLSNPANLLLGFLDSVNAPGSIGVVAAGGSGLYGVRGKAWLGGPFSVQGGIAYVTQPAGDATVTGGVMYAASARYVTPNPGYVQWFAEAGVWGSPHLDLRFARSYLESAGPVLVITDAVGSVSTFYGRAGAVVPVSPASELTLSATLATTGLASAYTESGAGGNLFAIGTSNAATRFNSIKGTAAWKAMLSPTFQLNLSGSIGRTFGTSTVAANWLGGAVAGTAGPVTFFEYGASVDWNFVPQATLSAFVAGTAGAGVGSHHLFGGSLRMTY